MNEEETFLRSVPTKPTGVKEVFLLDLSTFVIAVFRPAVDDQLDD